MSREVTLDQVDELSPQQLRAVELLAGGSTVTAAAAAVGCARETVSRWQKSPCFQVELNDARRELQEATRNRLLAASRRAADVVVDAIEQGDLKAALALVKGLGHLGGSLQPDTEADRPVQLLTATAIRVHLKELGVIGGAAQSEATQRPDLQRWLDGNDF